MICYMKACDKEHEESMLHYAIILYNGEVDEADSQKASIYFKKLLMKRKLEAMALNAKHI